MIRKRFNLAAVAAALAAVSLAACGSSGGKAASSQQGAAPDCLPKTLLHDAALAGGRVNVSPAPGSVTADPETQISFLGVPVGEVHDVTVRGSQSGLHEGRLKGYTQGDGGSFLLSKPFDSGEQVSVRATIGQGSEAKRISYSFGVDTPYSTASVGGFPSRTAYPSEYERFRSLPGVQAPVMTVTKSDEDPAAGDIFTTNGPGPGKYGPLIYTPEGRLVWFDQLSGGKVAEDLNVQSYEGNEDLTFWRGKVLSLGFGQGEDVVMNDHYQTVAKVKGGNGLQADLHDFQLASDGVSYNTAFNVIRCNLSSEEGPANGAIIDTAIQEIDVATGLVRWEWHSLDHVGANESEVAPPEDKPWDWFHINSIDPQGNGDVFISARNTWAGYEIEERSGKILWHLGGSKSSFKMGPGTKTAFQHDGRIQPNGEVTFFDDGSNPPVHSQSRAIKVALDFNTHEAHLTSSFTHPSPLLAASQGNVQVLGNGNSVVGYGGIAAVSEYSPSGSLLFDAHLPLDMSSYRAYRHPWHGEPTTPPAVVANLNNTGEETIVHMSWNGATNVTSWRVLAGKKPSSLKPLATVPCRGFESEAILTKKYAWVEAQALGSTGAVLKTSKAAKPVSYAASFEGESK